MYSCLKKVKNSLLLYISMESTKPKNSRRKYQKIYHAENRARVNKRRRDWKKKIYDKIAEYKERTGCLNPNCKYKDKLSACQLDFAHFDKTTKVASIAALLAQGSLRAIQIEITKCTLLCANCHRLETYKDLKIDKLPRCNPID